MYTHQKQLLQPHMPSDHAFDNELFQSVNQYMNNTYEKQDLQSEHTMIADIEASELTAAIKHLKINKHPGKRTRSQ